jgi:hypothetical protein
LLDRYPWLEHHPHVRDGWQGVKNNRLYIGSEYLQLPGLARGLRGYGTFRRGVKLTAEGESRSIWQVPDWMCPSRGGTGISHHPQRRWRDDGLLRSAHRGQEFVANIDGREDAIQWLVDLFRRDGHD